MWYAVNKNGRSFLFSDKPERHYGNCWFDAINMSRATMTSIQVEVTRLPFLMEQLPALRWEDEPIEVFVVDKQDYEQLNK